MRTKKKYNIKTEETKQENIFKNYDITFTTKDKYTPVTRTITIRTNNEYNAIDIVHRLHGSFHHDKQLGIPVPTDKIKIDKIQEVDEFNKEKI